MDEETTRLHQRLDLFWAKLNDLDKGLTSITMKCVPCSNKIDGLEDVINGNGRDGLKSDVRALQTLISDIHEKQEARLLRIHNEQMYLSRWIKRQISVIIVGVITLLGLVIKSFLTL